MSEEAQRPAFTLRFKREQTHEALRHAARELGLSMSDLAERAIEHELASVGYHLEEKLAATVRLLRPFRREDLKPFIEQFVLGEVEQDDPLRARQVGSMRPDSIGVGAAFGDPVER